VREIDLKLHFSGLSKQNQLHLFALVSNIKFDSDLLRLHEIASPEHPAIFGGVQRSFALRTKKLKAHIAEYLE